MCVWLVVANLGLINNKRVDRVTVVSTEHSFVETVTSGHFLWISCCCERKLCDCLATSGPSVNSRKGKRFDCPARRVRGHLRPE